MKKRVALSLVFVSMLSLPATAHAAAKNAKTISWGWLDVPEACGGSFEVTDSEGGLTDGTEKLDLGAKYAYPFGPGGFEPAPGEFGIGKAVLFASPSYVAATGAKADITIPDADCKDFNMTGGTVRFSGSLGMYPDIVKFDVPQAQLNRSFDGLGGSVDLTANQITIRGYTGSWTIGSLGGMSSGTSGTSGTGGTSGGAQPSSPSGDSGSSCSSSGAGSPPWAFVFALPVVATLLRRGRRRPR